jgi:hypothetical protein
MVPFLFFSENFFREEKFFFTNDTVSLCHTTSWFMYECRWDDRLKPKGEGSTRLTYTGLLSVARCSSPGLEHLKVETMGECVISC